MLKKIRVITISSITTLCLLSSLFLNKQSIAQTAISEVKEPPYHFIINQTNGTMTIDDGRSQTKIQIGVAKTASKRIPKGLYTVDIHQVNKGVTHFSGWNNPNLIGWYTQVIVPMKNGVSGSWPKGTMVPAMHTEPQNCPGLQNLIRQKKNLTKYCPPPKAVSSKGYATNGCIRMNLADAKSVYDFLSQFRDKSQYPKILVE
jgi:hypothetical protein